MRRFSFFLKEMFKNFIQRKNHGAMFLMGALNGLLPCGLSFLAFASCLALSGPVDGFVFMIVFGIGTLPVMLGFTGMLSWISNKLQLDRKRLTTGLLIFSGALLIARVFIVHLPHAESLQQGVVDIILCR
jgi:sulfite exporter TauE/SafE